MYISVTTPNMGNYLVEMMQVVKIVENANSGDVTVNLVNSQKPITPAETLDQIFDQQNVSGKSLNMILINNVITGNREIWFTHTLWMITPSPSGGAILHPRVRKLRVEASETTAAIFAYQGGSKQLGMLALDVVKYGEKEVNPGGNVQMIFINGSTKRIVSSDPAVPLSNAVLHMHSSDKTYEVDQDVAAIFALS